MRDGSLLLGEARSRQGRAPSPIALSTRTDANTAASNSFLVLTLACVTYLLFALACNSRLIETASVGSAAIDLEFVKNSGTLITGLGASLLGWRLLRRVSGGQPLLALVTCILVSVSVMWGLQEMVVRALVSAATPAQLRWSYIASLATDSMRNDPRPLKSLEWLSSENHTYDRKIFIALFPAVAQYDTGLIAGIEAVLPSLVSRTVAQRTGSASAQFLDYENVENNFKRVYNESYAPSAQRVSPTHRGDHPNLESSQTTEAAVLLALPEALPPGLSWDQFRKRDDIRESFARQTGFRDALMLDFGMQQAEFVKRVYEPMIRLREADLLRPLDTATGFIAVGSIGHDRGVKTYTNAVDLGVNLAFSLLFGLLNALTVVASIVWRSPSAA